MSYPLQRRTVLATIGSGVVALAGSGVVAGSRQNDLAEVRQATAKYQNADKAIDDGYVEDDHCEPDMGVHFINPELLSTDPLDPDLDPTEPEALVYEPKPNDNYDLVAVEYLVPDPDEDRADAGGRPPTLLGEDFDYLPVGEGMWALHAWVWLDNPNGMFAHHNPRVSCEHFAEDDA